MRDVTVGAVTYDDIDQLVASVVELFREDAGQHDSSIDITWPICEGVAY